MLNLISSVLQQECKQESESLYKGRITGSAPPPEKNAPFPEWRTVSRIFISGPWQVCRARGLARNQAQKNTPDWVKLSSVDERVDADIEICDGQHSVEVILINCGLNKKQKKNVDIHRLSLIHI